MFFMWIFFIGIAEKRYPLKNISSAKTCPDWYRLFIEILFQINGTYKEDGKNP
ncbi:hypothetical protein [Persephonella sp.]